MSRELRTIAEELGEGNFSALSEKLFGYSLTPKQEEIVRKIVFKEKKRMVISATTQWGKSRAVSIGIALYILTNENKRIAGIGPKREQAEILRNYFAELAGNCVQLRSILQMSATGYERLQKEASKTRLTFTNGCEYRIFSAYDAGDSLMGFGADLIIVDEGCMVSNEAYTKITRMLGSRSRDATMIILMNPWDKDNFAYDAWLNPNWDAIHIDWRVAVEEGRVTEEFIAEQKLILAPLAFTVLYESHFPEQSEDSLFNASWIEAAAKKKTGLLDELKKQLVKTKERTKISEAEYNAAMKELEHYRFVVSCDPADKGLDLTVIYWGLHKDNEASVYGHFTEAVSDNMLIASRIYRKAQEFCEEYPGIIVDMRVDGHGIGVGVISRLQQLLREHPRPKLKVKICLFGGKAIKEKLYANLKAENYFRLKDYFKDGRISLEDECRARSTELEKMKWEMTSGEKIKIVDPEKSPDYADALVYFVWKDTNELSFVFG